MTHNTEGERCDYTASFPAEPFVEDRAAMVRNAALEEAAKACDAHWRANVRSTDPMFQCEAIAAGACAKKIRALKTS